MIEYIDTGVSQQAIGDPTDEEKEKLTKEGYMFMSWGKMKCEPYEYFEIWLKKIERKKDIKYCKDCYWYSDVTVKCCERDGFSEPCDPEGLACSLFEPKEE